MEIWVDIKKIYFDEDNDLYYINLEIYQIYATCKIVSWVKKSIKGPLIKQIEINWNGGHIIQAKGQFHWKRE